MRKITGFLIALLIMAATQAYAPGTASGAIYPTKKWTFRVKPDLLQNSVFLMDGLVVLESSNHTLNFVNSDTGEKVWQFGLYAPTTIYLTGDGGLVALSDNILHRLDVTNKKILWSVRLKKQLFEKLLIAQDKSHIVIQYGERSFETLSLGEMKKPYGSTTAPPDCSELHAEKTREFSPNLAGARLSISGPDAELREGDAVKWTFTAESPLARTAAMYGNNYVLLLSSSGKIHFVNLQTGGVEESLNILEFIQMRFWDEKPESIDNYAESMLMTDGDKIYLAGPSSFSRFGLKSFPDSISLKPEKKQDSTYGWALEKAISLWDGKNYNEAVKGMEEAARMWPEAPEARLFLGMAHSTTGNTDAAIAELETGLALDPQNPDILSNLVGNYMIKIMALNPEAQYQEIVDLYEKIKALQPDNKMAYIGLAELYIGKKDYDSARAVVMESFNNGFFSADMNLLLLSSYYLEGKNDEALVAADEAISLFPNLATPRLIKGKLQCKRGAYLAAINTFSSIPADKTSTASLLPRYLTSGHRFFHGNALGLTGEYDKAAKLLMEYVEWLPSAEQRKKLGEAYAKIMDGKEPSLAPTDRKLLEKYSGKNSMELEAEIEFREPAILAAAHFFILAGKKEKAFSLLKKANNGGAHDPEISSYIGYLYCLGGKDLARATRYTEEALKNDPADPVFMRNNAVCLSARGDNKGSEAMFRKAIELNTDTELLRYEYGKLLQKLKRNKEAAEQFKAEMKISPDIKLPKTALAATGR